MANKNSACIVCGASPTVKSHLFPRALMLDMRGDAKSLYEGSRHKAGYKELQNGPWDDRFLCKRHEDLAGAGDYYAVDFCRAIAAGKYTPSHGGRAMQMDNPDPGKLVRFVYGTVWRHVHAPLNDYLRMSLGPYDQIIARALFDGGPLDLPVIVSLSNLTGARGEPVDIALAPYQQKAAELHVWHFVLRRLDVMLKTDNRPFPPNWGPYLANGNDPVVLHVSEPRDLAIVPLLRPITDRIRASGAVRRRV